MAGRNGFAETSVRFVQRAKASTFGDGQDPGGPVAQWPGGPVPVLLEAQVTAAFTSGKKDEARSL